MQPVRKQGIWDARDLHGDRKWQIGDPARLGPLIYRGPLPRPSTSGSSPSSLKGQSSAQSNPRAPPPSLLALRVPFLPGLPSPQKATSSKLRKNWNLGTTTPDGVPASDFLRKGSWCRFICLERRAEGLFPARIIRRCQRLSVCPRSRNGWTRKSRARVQ